jgi:hypothetical protein
MSGLFEAYSSKVQISRTTPDTDWEPGFKNNSKSSQIYDLATYLKKTLAPTESGSVRGGLFQKAATHIPKPEAGLNYYQFVSESSCSITFRPSSLCHSR